MKTIILLTGMFSCISPSDNKTAGFAGVHKDSVTTAALRVDGDVIDQNAIDSTARAADSIRLEYSRKPLPPYSHLTFSKKERIQAGSGTKSVVFNSERSKLYSMNLEGMSVFEYDRVTRKVLRKFQFEKTKGTGWNYSTDRPIPSYEEKPVEAWLTDKDRILWVSLHNAGGIVPIQLDSLSLNTGAGGKPKRVKVTGPDTTKTAITVPLIETGSTPKIIISTSDEKHLLVSNWHGLSVSVLDLQTRESPFARMVKNIKMPAIPRGMVSDPTRKKTYVAIMGGSSLAVINENDWTLEKVLQISGNPRHVLQDSTGNLVVSFNVLGRLSYLEPETGKTLFSTKTADQPRTIALSRNQSFVFVTCYTGNMLEVYKRLSDRFEKVASLPCPGHPVGVDLYEDEKSVEAWVCSYDTGDINVFTFDKK